jgi:hypothetical protein
MFLTKRCGKQGQRVSRGRMTLVMAIAALGIGFVAACGSSTTPSGTTPSGTTPHATGPVASAPPNAAPPAPTLDGTAGWLSYTSPANHLTFMHPPDMRPLECGWVFIDPTNPPSCPQGDGFCCVFFRSSDNGQTGAFSSISSNPNLFADGIQRTTVTVDGVMGTRLSGIQTEGQGGGPQVEYDFTTMGRVYTLFAYVSGSRSSLDAAAPSASLFDQIVQTVMFTR